MGQDEFERIQPVDLDVSGAAPTPATTAGRAVTASHGVWLALAALLLVAASVVFLLPRLVSHTARHSPASDDKATSAKAADKSAAPSSPSTVATPWEQAQIERQRAAAKSALDALIAVQFELQE